jgi:hypothetical protein
MKETTIAFVIFFSTVTILVQIQIIRRLRRIRKMKGERLGGTQHVEFVEALEICCCCAEAAAGGGETVVEVADRARKEKEKREEIKRLEPDKKNKRKYRAYQELLQKDTSKVTELIAGKEQASIWWLVSNSKVPKFRVIEIFEKNPNYVILEGKIYNKAELSEDVWGQLILLKEKICNICVNCENPVEKGAEYCASCGEKIQPETIKSE